MNSLAEAWLAPTKNGSSRYIPAALVFSFTTQTERFVHSARGRGAKQFLFLKRMKKTTMFCCTLVCLPFFFLSFCKDYGKSEVKCHKIGLWHLCLS